MVIYYSSHHICALHLWEQAGERERRCLLTSSGGSLQSVPPWRACFPFCLFISVSLRDLYLWECKSEGERERRCDGGEGAQDLGGPWPGGCPVQNCGRHCQRRGGLWTGCRQAGVPEWWDNVSPELLSESLITHNYYAISKSISVIQKMTCEVLMTYFPPSISFLFDLLPFTNCCLV